MSKPIWIICTEDAADGLVEALKTSDICPFKDMPCDGRECEDCIKQYIDFEIVESVGEHAEKKPTRNEIAFREWANGLVCDRCPVPCEWCKSHTGIGCGVTIMKWLAEDDDND